ncbi:MAG: ParB/RepB/Spo0J family partition protein [Dehalococcoidia bacterium]
MTASIDRLSSRALVDIPVSAVIPNPNQPRRLFKGIDELAASIKTSGLLQPITLRPRGDGTYSIIAGERRYRAISTLGWATIPALVVDQEETEAYRLSVLENMARKDMTPVEEATALKQLLETMSPCEAAAAVGYGADDGGQVTWKVKLLDAIPEAQDLVNKGHLNQTKAIQMSRLSRNGQLEVLRKAGSRPLNDREWGALCDTIYIVENQPDMFPETKVSPETVRKTKDFHDAVSMVYLGIQRMQGSKVEDLRQGGAQLSQLSQSLDQAIRALASIKRQVETETGRAIALELEGDQS